RGCRRLGVSVHHQHIAIQDKDGCVAVGQSLRLGERSKDSFGHLLDGKQIGARRLCLRARPTSAKECFFENTSPCQHTCKRATKEIAASMSVMMAHGTSRD